MGIFNFLSSNNHKVVIEHGKAYLVKQYKVNGKSAIIKVERFDQNPDYVQIGIFRDNTNRYVELQNYYLITDFFQDVDFFMKELANVEANQQEFWKALSKMISNHINRFKKLIDTDLEGYLDTFMRVVDSIFISKGYQKMQNQDGKNIRSEFRNYISRDFKSHIWVNKIDPYNPLGKTRLIKLTDL